MNFNHDIGTIDTILTIDTTIAPPLGGTTGVLAVTGTGAISLPAGTTAQQPTGVAGMFRWNSTVPQFEGFNGTSWVAMDKQGTVTSVAATGSTGLTIGGSPVTTSGTITLTLGTELQGLSGLSTTGVVVRTGAGLYTSRSVTGTASNIVVTNGDGVAGAPTINLATAGTPVTASFVKITTDTFGRVTATTAPVTADITTALGYTPVNKAGDTVTGTLTFSGGATITGLPAPTNSSDVVNKAYVDAAISSLNIHESVEAASTVNLNATYSNGTAGVGATLTNAGTQAAFAIDGYTGAIVGTRILVKNQTTQTQNGIYTVTTVGSASTNWVLTRATDADNSVAGELAPGDFVFITEGTQASTGWVETTVGTGTGDSIVIGTNNVTYVQFSGAGTYSAGTGLTLTGTQFSLTNPVATNLGGTGLAAIGTANQILGVNAGATGLEYKTVSAGTGVSVTQAANSITVANTGVTSLTGTTNQVSVSGSTGAVTLSLPNSVTINTALTVTGLTANSFLYSGTAGLLTTTTAPTNGQLLIGSTGAAPVAATITAGTGITVTNGAGSITIAATTTGTVSSVALAAPSIFTVSGSPVTTSGTLTLTLASQTANTVFAAPNGSAGAPTFRTLAYADLPIVLYKEAPSSPTTPVSSGTNSVAVGSGSASSGNGTFAVGKGTSATLYGAKAFSNDSFATAGDSQTGMYQLRAITTTAAVTELFLDAAGAQRLVLPSNSVWAFSIFVAARRTDAVGGGAGYKFEGVIRKDTTAGSTTLIGTPSKSILGETNVGWDVTLTADTTNGSLKITGTGEAAKTIRWVATVTTTEVSN
jgi:hypothetical protein